MYISVRAPVHITTSPAPDAVLPNNLQVSAGRFPYAPAACARVESCVHHPNRRTSLESAERPSHRLYDEELTGLRAVRTNPRCHGTRVVTHIAKLKEFFPAEEYHKNYFKKNTSAPYCQLIIEPKVEKVRKRFAELVKQ